MRKNFVILFALFCLTFRAFCADAEYKLVRVETLTNAVRVRLPLTDVTGKVRVKEKTVDGFGIPVAPSKVSLGRKHYLEWQIGYDTPDAKDITDVPEIKFTRKGETKYGHELSKIIFEAVRLGLISTNDLLHEIEALKKFGRPNLKKASPCKSRFRPIRRQMDFKVWCSGCRNSPKPRRTARCKFSSSKSSARSVIRRWFTFASP